MGVSRTILPTEEMDYTKPDLIISQLEEKPDCLDKASLEPNSRNMCERPMVYITVDVED